MKAVIVPTDARPVTCYPLTVTRDLADCPVANRTLRELQEAELRAAGFEVVEAVAGGESAVYLLSNAWADREGLAMVAAGSVPMLLDHRREVGAYLSTTGHPPQATGLTLASSRTLIVRYPWDLLTLNEILLGRIEDNLLDGQVDEGVFLSGKVVLGEGSHLLPGVFIEGTAVIGTGCKIGPNAYLRGPVTIGDNCHIGQAVEVKASIVMRGSSLGHLTYVGDSIVGEEVNLGAGTITANFRHDGRNHRSLVDGVLIDTGRRKFGTIVGDGVHTGIHTSIYPGRKLWPRTWTRPGDIVQYDLVSSLSA